MTRIEWTEKTWNVTTGCTKLSPGCKHCYAEAMARRLQAMGAPGYENGFKLSLMPERLEQPLHRRKPTLWFVDSMSDLFHEEIPETFLDQVFTVIGCTPWHTYQILTKRAERMRDYFATRAVPVNAWLGVTVEDRQYGLPRLEALRQIEARIRFVSAEPLLEDLEGLDLTGINQVIVGGKLRTPSPAHVSGLGQSDLPGQPAIEHRLLLQAMGPLGRGWDRPLQESQRPAVSRANLG